MEAFAEDLICSVINWVQTFILTSSGGLLQTEVRSYPEGYKRLWPHEVFQKDTRLLCQEAQCPPEFCVNYRVRVSTANRPCPLTPPWLPSDVLFFTEYNKAQCWLSCRIFTDTLLVFFAHLSFVVVHYQ